MASTVAQASDGKAEHGVDDQLMTLLEYEGVIGVLATTPDGLVVAAAGVEGDDAEIVGAAGSIVWASLDETGETSGCLDVDGGAIHVLLGNEVSLVALTDPDVPHEPLVELMRDRLDSVASLFT